MNIPNIFVMLSHCGSVFENFLTYHRLHDKNKKIALRDIFGNITYKLVKNLENLSMLLPFQKGLKNT